MKVIQVTRGDRKAAAGLVGVGVPEDVGTPTVTAPCLVVDEHDEPVLLTARMDPADLLAFRQAAQAYPVDATVYRAAGIRNRASVYGYSARSAVMQRNCCRECAGKTNSPEAHAGLVATTQVCARMFRELLPEVAERDEEAAAEAILAEWRMGGTQWTSGVLNSTSALPYHYDKNNLGKSWSAMTVARRGVRGGHLHIPELGTVVDCRDGDVVFFQGSWWLHGVTPIRKTAADAYRFSAVNYTVKRMSTCLPPEDELAWGRADRTSREAAMAAGLEVEVDERAPDSTPAPA